MMRCRACKKVKIEKGALCPRCARFKTKFNVEPEDANTLYNQQLGLCAICRKPPTEKRSLVTDQDHKTGKIRGFLCTRCNMGLGYLSTPTLLQAAATYLNAEPQKMRYLVKQLRITLTDGDIQAVIDDPRLIGLRAKARALAGMRGINTEAALSKIRRFKNSTPTGCDPLLGTTTP